MDEKLKEFVADFIDDDPSAPDIIWERSKQDYITVQEFAARVAAFTEKRVLEEFREDFAAESTGNLGDEETIYVLDLIDQRLAALQAKAGKGKSGKV